MSDQPARPHGSDSRVADGWTVGFALALLGTVAYLLFTPGGHDPQDATG
jgi:hypothetical protein